MKNCIRIITFLFFFGSHNVVFAEMSKNNQWMYFKPKPDTNDENYQKNKGNYVHGPIVRTYEYGSKERWDTDPRSSEDKPQQSKTTEKEENNSKNLKGIPLSSDKNEDDKKESNDEDYIQINFSQNQANDVNDEDRYVSKQQIEDKKYSNKKRDTSYQGNKNSSLVIGSPEEVNKILNEDPENFRIINTGKMTNNGKKTKNKTIVSPDNKRYVNKNISKSSKEKEKVAKVEKVEQKRIKIVTVLTPTQEEAKRISAPKPEIVSKNNWNFQLLPPNISQVVYTGDNKHLNPVMFPKRINQIAFYLIQNRGNVEHFKAILSKVEDINIQNTDGNTMLMYAVSHRNYPVINSLLKKGADVNIVNQNMISSLHIAAYSDDIKSLSLLLEHGARTNVLDSNDVTPLMYAVINKSRNAVRMLVNYGSDVNMENNANENAIEIAQKIGDELTVEFLKKKSLKRELINK